MKKILTLTLIVFAIVCAVRHTYQLSEEGTNALVMANIEALTSGEPGKWDYPEGRSKTYECGYVYESHWYGDDVCSFTVESCVGGGSGCNTRKCPQHG